MKKYNLNEMKLGWFIGNFSPSIIQTPDFEVAIKEYKKNSFEERHYHLIAKEITVIVSGKVIMNGKEFIKGDIIVIEPGESSNFVTIEDTVTAVVKVPSAKNDKYIT